MVTELHMAITERMAKDYPGGYWDFCTRTWRMRIIPPCWLISAGNVKKRDVQFLLPGG